MLGVVVVGGIYSPQPPYSRWGGCLLKGAPDSPVRQPRHPTVRVLKILTVEALTSCCTGQVLFTIRCASDACSDFYVHCSRTVYPFADDRCAR
jgi:hypothetical protein